MWSAIGGMCLRRVCSHRNARTALFLPFFSSSPRLNQVKNLQCGIFQADRFKVGILHKDRGKKEGLFELCFVACVRVLFLFFFYRLLHCCSYLFFSWPSLGSLRLRQRWNACVPWDWARRLPSWRRSVSTIRRKRSTCATWSEPYK